jgi:hypothetical protein
VLLIHVPKLQLNQILVRMDILTSRTGSLMPTPNTKDPYVGTSLKKDSAHTGKNVSLLMEFRNLNVVKVTIILTRPRCALLSKEIINVLMGSGVTSFTKKVKMCLQLGFMTCSKDIGRCCMRGNSVARVGS